MSRLFEQNRIAIVWDFDKTLIPRYMQVPLFERYDIAEQGFWDEVGDGSRRIESRGQKVNHETFYLNVLLRHVRDGRMAGLDNAALRQLGAELEFFPVRRNSSSTARPGLPATRPIRPSISGSSTTSSAPG